MDEHAISFGPYRLLAAQRLLLERDQPVRLGSRAFDVLAALVERAGEVVGKEELISRAWPQTFVEEANLKMQVSALRRALGDGQGGHRYVITAPGRGYNFVHVIDAAASLAAAVLTGVPWVNILATSREPLRAAGEREYRLGPLNSPQPWSGQTAAEAAAFPAVKLFVERATAVVEDFVLTDANAP